MTPSASIPDLDIVPLSRVNFEKLVAYDTDIHRIRREDWIKPLTELPDSVAAMNSSNQLVGYLGIEHCPEQQFTQLKPLLADTSAVAAKLLNHALKVTPKGFKLKVKVLSENVNAMTLMEKVGFSTEIKPPDMIMFSKTKFQIKTDKVYSVLNGWNQFA